MSLDHLFEQAIRNIINNEDVVNDCSAYLNQHGKRKSKARRALDAFIMRNQRETEELEQEAKKSNIEAQKASRRRGDQLAMELSLQQMQVGAQETYGANPHVIVGFKDYLMADGDDVVREDVFSCDAVEAFEADDEEDFMDEKYLAMLNELPASPTYYRSARAEKAGRNVASGERAIFARDIKDDAVIAKQRKKTQSRVTVTREGAKAFRRELLRTLGQAYAGVLWYFRSRKFRERDEVLQNRKALEEQAELRAQKGELELEQLRNTAPKFMGGIKKKFTAPKQKKQKKQLVEVNNGIPFPYITPFGQRHYNDNRTIVLQ